MLDWVETEYTKEWLLKVADAVGANPHPIQTKAANGMPGVWDPAIEGLLRRLAESKKALAALNGQRTLPPTVGLNRAVHYHVEAALHPKTEAARAAVAKAWGATPGQVKDDVREYRVSDPKRYRHDDAVRIFDTILHNSRVRTGRTREGALEAFNADMYDRAAQYCALKSSRRKKST